MGSIVIPHLVSGWHVDQAILSEDERIVVIRFGRDGDPDCMRQDEVLAKIQDKVRNFAVIYLCDNVEVPDFNRMYELYDPCTIMFFFRNKHMMVDFGTGNNNKLNWVLEDAQEMIDILETVYRGAKKGRGLVVSPKGRFSFYFLLRYAMFWPLECCGSGRYANLLGEQIIRLDIVTRRNVRSATNDIHDLGTLAARAVPCLVRGHWERCYVFATTASMTAGQGVRMCGKFGLDLWLRVGLTVNSICSTLESRRC